MKSIAYLTGSWPVWSETFIRQEVRLYLQAGLPLLPVAIGPGTGKTQADDPEVIFLQSTIAAPSTQTARWLPGIMRRQAALMRHGDKLEALAHVIETNEIGHVHAAFGGLPALLAAAATRQMGLSYSVSVHANDVITGTYDDRFVFGDAKFVLACNQRIAEELADRAPWLSDRIYLVPHGLCLEKWPNRDWRAPHSPLRLLFVGRMVEKKCPQSAQRLTEALNASGIPAQITFVGEGPLSTGLRVTGAVARETVALHMADSDFLINTSVEMPDGDMEGIPNVILEAMAVGLPVLATATGGIPEVVTEETGYIIQPGNPIAFCHLIRRLLAEPEECQRRAEAARRLVVKNFNAHELIQRRVEFFKALS